MLHYLKERYKVTLFNVFIYFYIKFISRDSWYSQLSSLRTPRYYGHPDNTDSGKNKLETFDWNKFPLLRTLAIKLTCGPEGVYKKGSTVLSWHRPLQKCLSGARNIIDFASMQNKEDCLKWLKLLNSVGLWSDKVSVIKLSVPTSNSVKNKQSTKENVPLTFNGGRNCLTTYRVKVSTVWSTDPAFWKAFRQVSWWPREL